jgi:hypothetical protein
VEIQNSPALSRALLVSSQLIAVAAGSLNRWSRVVTGLVIALPLPGVGVS